MIVDQKWIRFAAVMSSTVMVKAGLIVGSILLGKHLDDKFGTYPLLMFVFLLAGTGLGFVYLFHVMKRMKPK